jgi:hypothetical protein
MSYPKVELTASRKEIKMNSETLAFEIECNILSFDPEESMIFFSICFIFESTINLKTYLTTF